MAKSQPEGYLLSSVRDERTIRLKTGFAAEESMWSRRYPGWTHSISFAVGTLHGAIKPSPHRPSSEMNNFQSDSPDLANALHTLDLAGQDVDNAPFTIESISPSDVIKHPNRYITLLEPFMNFTDPATALLSFVGHDIYCRQKSVDDPPYSIVDFGPKGVGLYDVIFRDLSEVEFPPLDVPGVPGEGFSDKVSVRIRWPNYPDAEDEQINIRRSTLEREYVKTYKVLKKISELFLKFMIDQRDYEPPDGDFQWLLRPKGVIGFNNIIVQRILKVAPGSIQPVLACQIFEHGFLFTSLLADLEHAISAPLRHVPHPVYSRSIVNHKVKAFDETSRFTLSATIVRGIKIGSFIAGRSADLSK
ncbi:uncharacterized protein LAESUDRAFT_751382 [Laetiporus sulphureus 93-53]|uniref:Uncharacterized protein n=1 Tax=Laetiporus sulphureus 93-53 TaxID=1314785 RepID=A0A165D1V4_9APHY|nr:uncharacterized protein LAESUDRAFT_751382 [Laetiporus sulphureus 93-53]KZT03984.1 hypothetical protein LAESUDRAFT_751382 [Laetiporus sulphureus 93-53]